MSILTEAEKLINGDREEAYGNSHESCTLIAILWSSVLRMDITPEQVCLCMIQLKVAREINGHKKDNLVDIAGYAGVLEKVIEGAAGEPEPRDPHSTTKTNFDPKPVRWLGSNNETTT